MSEGSGILTTTAAEIADQVRFRAETNQEGALLQEAFTEWALDILEEKGEINGGDVCKCNTRQAGLVVSAYWHEPEVGQLDVFVSSYAEESLPRDLPKAEIKTLLGRAVDFMKICRKKKYRSLEEAGGAFDFGEMISRCSFDGLHGRLFLLTNRPASRQGVPESYDVDGCDFATVVVDLEHLASLISPGARDPIHVDFLELGLADGLAMLRMPWSNEIYETFIGMIPGEALANVYNRYRARLLEQNVRSFLQARGKVNRGIRDTILNSPEMFLAYNNGLCATASSVESLVDGEPLVRLRVAHDFQIVNGGQTTASLAAASVKDKADLTGVLVPLKLSVIKKRDQVAPFIASVARFANSQNKVSEADLAANDMFHIELEQLSRTVWTPSQSSAKSKWFYERARGQYADERGKCRTERERSFFDAEYPRNHWFTKTDLAKYENTWEQLPHIVSRGAQKNFTEFTIRWNNRHARVVPDERFFKRLVAKAILFKRAEKIVGSQGFGGYRANIVTYTLAWLSHRTAKGIDLDAIWASQGIDETLQEVTSVKVVYEFDTVSSPRVTTPQRSRAAAFLPP